jgi:hypothetical protein
MGDVLSFFTGNNISKAQSNNFRVSSKTNFKNKTSITDFRNRGANKIKFNGQELKAKEIRDVVGDIISGGHQTSKQIMRQLKDKYRVEQDDRRKIMRVVTEKYTLGTNANQTDTAKEFLKVNKILNDEGISSQTKKEIRDKIKHERETVGKSKTAENIEKYVKTLKRNIGYKRYAEGQRDISPGYDKKLDRKDKEYALKEAEVINGKKVDSTAIGVQRIETGSVVSVFQKKNAPETTNKPKTTASQISKAASVSGEHGGEHDNHEDLRLISKG